MKKFGGISKYNKLTPWYNEIMIAPKMSRDVCIYIDIAKTNQRKCTKLINTFTAMIR